MKVAHRKTLVATEEVTRLGACVFDLKFSSVSNNMHLVLSLTKVPLCTKGPPWVAPRKPPFGGLVLGGRTKESSIGDRAVAVASRPYFVLPRKVAPAFGPFGCTSVCSEVFFWVCVWCRLKVLITWNQAGLRVVTATTEQALRSAGIGYLSLANSLSFQ